MVYHSDFDYNTLDIDVVQKERVKDEIHKLEGSVSKRNYVIIGLSILSFAAIATIWVAYRKGSGQNVIPFTTRQVQVY